MEPLHQAAYHKCIMIKADRNKNKFTGHAATKDAAPTPVANSFLDFIQMEKNSTWEFQHRQLLQGISETNNRHNLG